jgi:choline monooxygenase
MSSQHLKIDFDRNIERAWTLPSWLYTDPAVLELERRRIFQRTWQLVGTTNQSCGEVNGTRKTLADPETHFTADLVGEPIVIARDTQGVLRAFSNVCRHRAGPIAEGAGCRNVFRCGYHGWTYTLDGRLIGTPDVEGMEFFDRSTMGMFPLQLAAWEQFLFVNMDCAAPPLTEFLEDIPEATRKFGIEGFEFAERRDYVLDCNWKVYVDNYLEGYHIPIAHPGLMREIDYSQYRVETHRYYSRQIAPVKPKAPGENGGRVYGSPGEEALYVWVFPNVMLNLYPNNLQINRILPLSQEKTLTVFEWYYRDAGSPAVRERMQRSVEFSHEVQQEDIHLCESVQKGLRSSTYDRGRYSVKRENGVHHFHSLLVEFLGQGQGAES